MGVIEDVAIVTEHPCCLEWHFGTAHIFQEDYLSKRWNALCDSVQIPPIVVSGRLDSCEEYSGVYRIRHYHTSTSSIINPPVYARALSSSAGVYAKFRSVAIAPIFALATKICKRNELVNKNLRRRKGSTHLDVLYPISKQYRYTVPTFDT